MLAVLHLDNDFDQATTRLDGLRLDLPDVAVVLGHHLSEPGQHAGVVFRLDDQHHRVQLIALASPLDLDLSLLVVQQVLDVRALDRVHRHTSAPCDVADDRLTGNWAAALGQVGQQIALALDRDGVAAEGQDLGDGATQGTRRLSHRLQLVARQDSIQ